MPARLPFRNHGPDTRVRQFLVSVGPVLGLVAALVVLVPTVFWRGTDSVFTTPKVTLLAAGVLGVLGMRIFVSVRSAEVRRLPLCLTVAQLLLLVTLGLSALASPTPSIAMTGAGVRHSGVLTWWLYMALFSCVVSAMVGRRTRALQGAFMVSAAGVVVYGLMQAEGVDPFDWAVSLSTGIGVQSTLGNPNFSSAFLALCLPFAVAFLFARTTDALPRVVSAVLVGLIMVMEGHLSSTQGDVGVALSLVVAGIWLAGRPQGSRLRAALLVVPLVLLVLAVPTVLRGPGSVAWPPVVALSALWGLAVVKVGGKPGGAEVAPGRLCRALRGRRRGLSLLLGALASIAGVLALPVLVRSLQDGMTERGVFWRVAWRMFQERPVLGHGLETYGAHFTRLRPVEHAMVSPTHLSDSPHSIPLGLLSGGGLLSLSAYLALLGLVTFYGGRGIRRAAGDDRLFLVATAAAWSAFQAQSLVSVDTVGVGFAQWVLAGILVSSGLDERWWGRGQIMGRLQRLGAGVAGRSLVAVTLVAVWAAMVLGPVSRPLRADVQVSRAHWAAAGGDLEEADRHFGLAIRLEPGNGHLVSSRGEVRGLLGFDEDAYRLAAEAARLLPGNSAAAVVAARAAVRTWQVQGRLSDARAWYRMALERDPYSLAAETEYLDFLQALGREGEADDVRAALEEHLTLSR